MRIKEAVKKQLRIKLIVAILIVAIIITFYGFNNSEKNSITGNVIIEPITNHPDTGCNFSGAIYNGSYFKVISPVNNTYSGKDNFNITIVTDYAGSDIITSCPEDEPTPCEMKIVLSMYTLEGKIIEIPTIELPKIYEGNRTYSYLEVSEDGNYTDGNFTLKAVAQYSCRADEYGREDLQVKVHLSNPTITEIYPTNNLVINISSNSTIRIFPKLNATDDLGILNKTISTGTGIISLTDQPNFNITLSSGIYTWNFTATDLAGNKQIITSRFTILNSTTNLTENETEEDPIVNDTLTNLTISFTQQTIENNKITNNSAVLIEVSASTNVSETNLTLQIYDETGRKIYQNSTMQKSLQITHRFIADGTYYYNATLKHEGIQKNTPTRKVIIDTESPSIEIKSPKTGQNVFTNSVVIEFAAEDTNEIAKMWFNDGNKNTDYTGKLNKTLEEGEYTWTVYAQDKAGNIAQETIKFSIIEKESSSFKKVAIIIIIISLILATLLIAYYFLRKKQEGTSNSTNQQTTIPPTGPTNGIPPQITRPMQPILNRTTPFPIQNQPTFKNNQPLR
jgi:hypothetical protein